jgi:hypothetical protein
LAESPAFPANNRIVTTWFPRRERAFATGAYTILNQKMEKTSPSTPEEIKTARQSNAVNTQNKTGAGK